MRRISALIILGLALASGAVDVTAQTTAAGSASITIPTVIYIEGSGLSVSFPAVTQAHYDAASVTGSASSILTTKSNVTHSVNLRANAATMTASGTGARANKPAADLETRSRLGSGGSWGSWGGLSSTVDRAVVTSRAAGSYTLATTQPEIEYRMKLDYLLDTPGTYSLAFTYTIVAN